MAISFAKVLNSLYLGSSWARIAIRNLLSDKRVRIIAIITIVLNFLAWAGTIFLLRFIGSEQAVLHYNVVFGIDLIGSALRLLIMPATGIAILVANLLLAASLSEPRDRLFSTIFTSVALLANLFIVIAVYFIYLINFS